MKRTSQTAQNQLLKLITDLNETNKLLNNDEFISVIGALKSICARKKSLDILIQSLNVLTTINISQNNKFTNREIQVLILIGENLKNTNIANRLNLSPSTVETHRKNIRKKLKLSNIDNISIFAFIFSLQYQSRE